MSQTDYKTLEQIAQLIETLPSDELLKQAWTADQRNEWHQSRNTQILLAKCWRAKFITSLSDPIAEALDNKEISKHKHDLINLVVNRYKIQWELVQLAENYVKQGHDFLQFASRFSEFFPKPLSHLWYKFFKKISLQEYPFKTAYDLFAETLIDETDSNIVESLQHYYEVTFKKWTAGTKQLSKIYDERMQDGIYPLLKHKEVNQLKKNFGWDKVEFSWIGFTLLICQLKAKDDPAVRRKLDEFYKSFHESTKLAATVSRKVRGFAWKNGEQVYASTTGGVYRKA